MLIHKNGKMLSFHFFAYLQRVFVKKMPRLFGWQTLCSIVVDQCFRKVWRKLKWFTAYIFSLVKCYLRLKCNFMFCHRFFFLFLLPFINWCVPLIVRVYVTHLIYRHTSDVALNCQNTAKKSRTHKRTTWYICVYLCEHFVMIQNFCERWNFNRPLEICDYYYIHKHIRSGTCKSGLLTFKYWTLDNKCCRFQPYYRSIWME